MIVNPLWAVAFVAAFLALAWGAVLAWRKQARWMQTATLTQLGRHLRMVNLVTLTASLVTLLALLWQIASMHRLKREPAKPLSRPQESQQLPLSTPRQ